MAKPSHRSERIPSHVAVIMDGNGRWAEQRNLDRTEGHRAGVEAVRATVRAAREIGVEWLTLYAFSSENWNRPKSEIDVLMKLPEEYFATELDEAISNGVRIRAIGRHDRLPPPVRRSLDEAIEKTREGSVMQLVFALSYGGRGEIVDAALDDPEMPDVDLLIRTGGEARISNFLLWQLAYAEIHWTDLMWPDFRREHLEAAIREFQGRERRFGLTGSQVRREPVS